MSIQVEALYAAEGAALVWFGGVTSRYCLGNDVLVDKATCCSCNHTRGGCCQVAELVHVIQMEK